MNEQQEREWEQQYALVSSVHDDAEIHNTEIKAFISRLMEEARREGRNEAVDSISTAMGVEEGKVVEVRPNFLQSLLDALEAARNKN